MSSHAPSSGFTLRPEHLEHLAAIRRENPDFRFPAFNALDQAEQTNVSSSSDHRDDEGPMPGQLRELEAEVERLRRKSSRDEATIRRLRKARNTLMNENEALTKRLAVSHVVVQQNISVKPLSGTARASARNHDQHRRLPCRRKRLPHPAIVLPHFQALQRGNEIGLVRNRLCFRTGNQTMRRRTDA